MTSTGDGCSMRFTPSRSGAANWSWTSSIFHPPMEIPSVASAGLPPMPIPKCSPPAGSQLQHVRAIDRELLGADQAGGMSQRNDVLVHNSQDFHASRGDIGRRP